MPPVPAPKMPAPQKLAPVPENAADAQGDTALPGTSSVTAAKQWLPAVEAAATDAGAAIHGWGESGLVSRELAVKGAVEHFREFLLGRDANQIGALWQEMYRSQYFEGGRVLASLSSALSAAAESSQARAPRPQAMKRRGA